MMQYYGLEMDFKESDHSAFNFYFLLTLFS